MKPRSKRNTKEKERNLTRNEEGKTENQD